MAKKLKMSHLVRVDVYDGEGVACDSCGLEFLHTLEEGYFHSDKRELDWCVGCGARGGQPPSDLVSVVHDRLSTSV